MIEMRKADDRSGWLDLRKGLITGTSASAIIGVNPHLDNAACWELLTGRREPVDLDGNPLVEYGRAAEDHLRELFRLDFPGLDVMHEPDSIVVNDRYPWAAASLDGWIHEEPPLCYYDDADTSTVKLGILEIKTATISSYLAKKKWENGIPDHYYTQVLHYMAVMEADFAIVVAQLKYEGDTVDGLVKVTRHYRIERSDVEKDIAYLMQEEEKFWRKYLLTDTRPPLKLNF